jgi:(1->4)-alpha-D-glucan 1-alpha-D-glucosylmutase
VTATGSAAGHLIAFSRGTEGALGALALATRLPAGLAADGGWRDTAVELPVAVRDELTGAGYGPGAVSVGEVLGTYPVALLVPVDGEKA